MYIERVAVQGFGPIDRWSAELLPTGIHYLEGPNGTGKTQIFAAMVAAIVGPPAKFLKLHEGGRLAAVQVRLADDHGHSVLGFESDGQTMEWMPTTGDARRDQLLSALARDSGVSLVANGEPNLQPAALALILEELRSHSRLRELATPDLLEVIEHGDLAILSMGQTFAISILYEVIRRLDAAVATPWLLDCPSMMFTPEMLVVVRGWIRKVAERHQVIWFDTQNSNPLRPDSLMVHALPALDDAGSRELAALSSSYNESLPFSREVVLAGLLRNADEAGGQIAAAAHEIVRSSEREPRTESVHAKLDRLSEQVREVLHQGSRILDSVNQIQESFAKQLEDAINQHDDLMVSRLAAQISDEIGRGLRQKHGSSIAEDYGAVEALIGPAWPNLSPITRKDLAIAWRIGSELPDEGVHLAILQVCRAIESEVQNNIFTKFKDAADEHLSDEDLADSESWPKVPRKYVRNLDELCKFVGGSGASSRLTLASFSFIIKAAQKCPDVPIFRYFLKWMGKEFGDDANHVMQLVVNFAMPSNAFDDGLPDALSNIRNRCAHPPSMREEGDELMSSETYAAVWRLAVEPPIAVLAALVARQSGA